MVKSMKCSICGARLTKEGDICANCYKEFQEEEELKKDNKEQLKLKRKYSISYEFLKYVELIIICILAAAVCLTSGGILEALSVFAIFGVIFGVLLFIDKRIALGTKATFYEKKVVYNFKLGFINTNKVVKYDQIDDIRIFQTRRQKKYGYGDLCIYTKSIIPGTGFFNGFQIKNIENIQENLNKIGEIIGINIEEKR